MNIYWKLGLFVAWSLLCVASGHEATVWYQGYKQTKAVIRVEKKAQKGQSDIIKFNQDYSKAKANEKDKCLSAPLSDDIKRLLH